MMTKILMNIGLLEYRRGIVDALRQILQRNYIHGAPQPFVAHPPFTQKHLMVAPFIGFIALDGYHGQGNDYNAPPDFGGVGLVAYERKTL